MLQLVLQRIQINTQLPHLIGQTSQSTVHGRCGEKTFNCQIFPEIRKSNEAWIQSSQFDQIVDPYVSAYLETCNQSESRLCNRWKMLEYNQGHFAEHIDRREENETHYQVATQILLPPKELCHYNGGILKIKEEGKVTEVVPCDQKWTHVIIPIGLPHQITPVNGTRISYVRQILVKKEAGKQYEKQQDVPGIQTLSVISF